MFNGLFLKNNHSAFYFAFTGFFYHLTKRKKGGFRCIGFTFFKCMILIKIYKISIRLFSLEDETFSLHEENIGLILEARFFITC